MRSEIDRVEIPSKWKLVFRADAYLYEEAAVCRRMRGPMTLDDSLGASIALWGRDTRWKYVASADGRNRLSIVPPLCVHGSETPTWPVYS